MLVRIRRSDELSRLIFLFYKFSRSVSGIRPSEFDGILGTVLPSMKESLRGIKDYPICVSLFHLFVESISKNSLIRNAVVKIFHCFNDDADRITAKLDWEGIRKWYTKEWKVKGMKSFLEIDLEDIKKSLNFPDWFLYMLLTKILSMPNAATILISDFILDLPGEFFVQKIHRSDGKGDFYPFLEVLLKLQYDYRIKLFSNSKNQLIRKDILRMVLI